MDDDAEPSSLQDQRIDAVTRVLLGAGARSVLDLGCGTGDLLERLAAHEQFERLEGIDISPVAVAWARDRVPGRVRVREGSFAQVDPTLVGFDAATLIETIEHVDPGRLSPVEQAVFGHHRPGTVVVTTPNCEYNVHYGLVDGAFRHPDHRFEWTRVRFRTWAGGVARRHGYRVHFHGIGPSDFRLGSPTQMAVLSRA